MIDLVLILGLIILSFQDMRFRMISVKSIVVMILIGLVVANKNINMANMILGIMLGVVLLFISIITKMFGLGDALVFTVIGGFMGVYFLMRVVLLSFFIAACFSIVLLALKKVKLNYELPLIPFIFIAFLGVLA